MFFVVKPTIQWFINTRILDSGHQLLLVITIILMSSVATELIGLHSIFGIFIAGLIMPSTLLTQVRPALTDVCNMLFVPLFFVISGCIVRNGSNFSGRRGNGQRSVLIFSLTFFVA